MGVFCSDEMQSAAGLLLFVAACRFSLPVESSLDSAFITVDLDLANPAGAAADAESAAASKSTVTEVVNAAGSLNMTTIKAIITCSDTCRADACEGPKASQCTACDPPKALMKGSNLNATSSAVGNCGLCHSNCQEGHCLGPLGSDCLSCKGGKTLLKADDARAHGSCISCSNTCKPGECSGDGANECTACFLGKTLVPLPGLSSGSCVTCADHCLDQKCIGAEHDKCTVCKAGRVLALNPPLSTSLKGNSSLDTKHGECVECDNSCASVKCVGSDPDQCVACKPGLIFTLNENSTDTRKHGLCSSCSKTCLPGHCIGSDATDCTKCPIGHPFVPMTGDKAKKLKNGTSAIIEHGACNATKAKEAFETSSLLDLAVLLD